MERPGWPKITSDKESKIYTYINLLKKKTFLKLL